MRCSNVGLEGPSSASPCNVIDTMASGSETVRGNDSLVDPCPFNITGWPFTLKKMLMRIGKKEKNNRVFTLYGILFFPRRRWQEGHVNTECSFGKSTHPRQTIRRHESQQMQSPPFRHAEHHYSRVRHCKVMKKRFRTSSWSLSISDLRFIGPRTSTVRTCLGTSSCILRVVLFVIPVEWPSVFEPVPLVVDLICATFLDLIIRVREGRRDIRGAGSPVDFFAVCFNFTILIVSV